jgi:peptide/nickel transport system permease protein
VIARPGSGAAPLPRTRAVIWHHLLPRLLTLFVISIIIFGSINALGIDLAQKALGRQATPAQLRAFRHEHGLDKPVVQRYLTWLDDFVHGDWGVSPLTGRSVRSVVQPAFVYTLILAVASLMIAIPLSLGLGIYMAKRPGSRRDFSSSIVVLMVAATPVYVIGVLLILILGVEVSLFPIDSTLVAYPGLENKAKAYVLPTLTLVIALIPHFSRLTRAAFRETLSSPYAQAAVLRGLPTRTITYRHLLPNAAAPIINVIALETMGLLGGVIIVENVFGFPGMGQLLVGSISNGDLISVEAIAMLTGILFVGLNFVADLLVVFLNPRLRS